MNEPHMRAVLEGRPQHFERNVSKADGRMAHASIHYVPDVVDGEVRGFVAQITDVTDVHAAKEAAEAANRAKSTFLANLSHEIRTPPSPISTDWRRYPAST